MSAPPIPPPICSPTCCRSEEHTSELQSRGHLVCRLLLEKKKRLIFPKQNWSTPNRCILSVVRVPTVCCVQGQRVSRSPPGSVHNGGTTPLGHGSLEGALQ